MGNTLYALHAYIFLGLSNRQVGSHLMNDHSSRSHSMLTVYINIESVRANDVYPQCSNLLLCLSVSKCSAIGQFYGPYFSIQLAKLELVSFPAHPINLRDMINILLTSFSRSVL